MKDNLLVVVVFVLAIFLLVVGRTLLGVDSWLTFVSGREIAQHGLPHHEALTTIPLGRAWTDQQWLAQLVFYGLDRIGGLGLAVVFHSLMVSSALAITMVASRVRGASSRMTLFAAVVCLLVAPWSWQLRAQTIALPLFALTLALVATDSRLVSRRTYLVFPTLALWANVHGSVILGVALVAFAGALGIFARAFRRETIRTPWWRPLLFLSVPWACLLVSPYGTGVIGYYRLLLVDSPVSKFVTEWQAPGPHGYFLVFFAVAAATVVLVAWQHRRLSPYDIGVLALTLAGASRSVRAVVWFSLAMAMLIPLALDGAIRPRRSRPVHRRLAAGLMSTLAAILAATALFTLTRSDAWFEHGWPARAARASVTAALASDGGATVWSGGTYADWLLWKETRLRGRVAWDVRFELLTEPELRSIVRFNAHKPGWRAALRGYPVLVLDRRENPEQVQALRREPGTHVLFADRVVIVLSREAP
ncbi:MAG: hypothetical protein EXQ81_10050 [Thermoleophilia bacterium]|nr:hypothetical protein [Thermoleophilia bacterium]